MVYVVSIVAFALLAFSLYALKQARSKLLEAEAIRAEVAQLGTKLQNHQRNETSGAESINCQALYLASLGQEMRSPLSGVLGMSELLLHTDLNTEQRELTNATIDSAHALLQIVSDLQELARLDADVLTDTTDGGVAEFRLHELVRDAAASCAEQARKKRLFLNSDIDPTIPDRLFGNCRNIKSALVYLIRNAISGTEKGGITLQCRRLSGTTESVKLMFCVKDTGVGMSSDEQQNLFGPLTPERWSTTYCGAGLGLYICKRLVDTVSGALTVQSKKGQGSEICFSVDLGIKDGATSVVSRPSPDVPAI